ncbi:MAG: threonine--tRNA ligase [Oscillospiraceae bacterium]|nr:threonine--tRNA ligase [Oscillospiraceae bacterium]
MLTITLKNGDVREVPEGTTVDELCGLLSAGLRRAACAAAVDGAVCDLRTPLTRDCRVTMFTFDDEAGKKAYWHTTSHILAQAVKRLYPHVKLAIGPAIDDGFYYDFDTDEPFTPDMLDKIEDAMRAVCKENLPITRTDISGMDAFFAAEPYKAELLAALPTGEATAYRQGEFADLCAGPHLMETGRVGAVKLLSATGAYWHGDAHNKMLTRIYGIAFPKASQLEAYLTMLEEAKKRDHNKLGRELELFTTADVVGQGLPILLPNGARVVQLLQRFVEDEEQKRGYLLTKTPLMGKSDIYKMSGHWDHYRDGMFVIGDEDKDKEVLALRPMTCPFQYQVFLNRRRSYRDLPMRLAETSTLFRNEDSGEMHGLIRVRQFTISEGHIICTPAQLEDEFRESLELARFMLATVGLGDDVRLRFSKWDENDRDKYIGTPEQWNEAQDLMRGILDDLNLEYTEEAGEAAFYGPKLDIQIRNVFGKEDTLITLQVDMMLAQRFNMEYVDEHDEKQYPYIIHRTSLGCYERTLALLIEKYAGAFPLWLAPEQVRVLPISERLLDAARGIERQLAAAGLRVTADERGEKIGYKIREAQLAKIPYMLIVGDKEAESGTVSVRSRNGGDLGAMALGDFAEKMKKEIEAKIIA